MARLPLLKQSLRWAEEYDLVGEGLAYHETTEENIPGAYRPNEGVDVEANGVNIARSGTGPF